MRNTREIDGRTFREVRIRLPLPGSVATTLVRLIDSAWPGAVLAASDARWGDEEMVVLVPADAAPRKSRWWRRVRAQAPALFDGELSEVGPDTIGFSGDATEYLVGVLAPIVRAAFEQNTAAINYLEMPVVDQTNGARYLLTIARSAHQTPHELRTQAEVRARAAEDAHAQLVRALADARADAEDARAFACAVTDLIESPAHRAHIPTG